jgi:hypothetical protein
LTLDTMQAASGNSLPVIFTTNLVQISSDSKSAEPICALEKSNFEIDTLEVPYGGKDARILSFSPTYASLMNAPASCSYLISIVPITDYLILEPQSQQFSAKPSPTKQNTWVKGIYTLRLRYMNDGNEIASKTFSFTIGKKESSVETSKFNKITRSIQGYPQAIL